MNKYDKADNSKAQDNVSKSSDNEQMNNSVESMTSSLAIQQIMGNRGLFQALSKNSQTQSSENEAVQGRFKAAIQSVLNESESNDEAAASSSVDEVLQGVFVDSDNTKDLITEQKSAQNYPDSYKTSFTTVGFEHEFAQMQGSDHDLRDVTHVELSESSEKLPYTDLGFSLETDASNAIEFVSPPFIVETMADKPIPKSADVQKIDDMIKTDLTTLATGSKDIGELLSNMPGQFGLTFSSPKAKIESSNINASTPSRIRGMEKNESNQIEIGSSSINTIPIKLSMKTGKPDISSQVNFATDSETYDTIKKMSEDDTYNVFVIFQDLENRIYNAMAGIIGDLRIPRKVQEPYINNDIYLFLRELARNFSETFAVPSIEKVEKMKSDMFKGDEDSNRIANNYTGSKKEVYDLHTGIRSHVKDIHGVWLKDTVMNFGLGILTKDQWLAIMILMYELGEGNRLDNAVDGASLTPFGKKLKSEVQDNIDKMKVEMNKSRDELVQRIIRGRWHIREDSSEDDAGPKKRPEFGSHDSKWLGARQDTFIPKEYVKRASVFADKTLHVIEVRGDAVETIENLEIAEEIRGTTKSDAVIAEEKSVEVSRVSRIRASL